MADFVINELVIEQLKTDAKPAKHVYAYYKKLMEYHKKCPARNQEILVEKENATRREITPEEENANAILDYIKKWEVRKNKMFFFKIYEETVFCTTIMV